MTEVIERDATLSPVKRDTPPAAKPPKLLDQVRDRIRVLHYSRSTESTYLYWIKFYIHFHGLRHPKDMGAAEKCTADCTLRNPRFHRRCRAVIWLGNGAWRFSRSVETRHRSRPLISLRRWRCSRLRVRRGFRHLGQLPG